MMLDNQTVLYALPELGGMRWMYWMLVPDPSVGFVFPGVRRLQARHILLETPSSVEITLDGEIRACTPAEISIAPGPLQVLVPRLRRTAPNTAPLAER